jgi:hypothetical protein
MSIEKKGLFLLPKVSSLRTVPTVGKGARPRVENFRLERVEAECFVCGLAMTTGDANADSHITKEDVFPKWLVAKMELGCAEVSSLAGDWQPYPGILVPCCRICNNVHMGQVEDRMLSAVKSYDKFLLLSPSDLALWSAKVYYGLLHLEARPWDFKKKSGWPGRGKRRRFSRILRIRMDGCLMVSERRL